MKLSTLAVLLIVIGAIVIIMRRDPQIAGDDLSEYSPPEAIGEPWDGRQAYVLEPDRAYRIPVRCHIADRWSLEAIETGKVAPQALEFRLFENRWAMHGVQAHLLWGEVKEVTHQVWRYADDEYDKDLPLYLAGNDKAIPLYSGKDGMTAITAGRLSREELVERYNERLKRDRGRRRRRIDPLEVYRSELTQLEIHLDAVLYLPASLPLTGDDFGALARESSVRASRYGMRVAFEAPDLPAYAGINYFSAADGRYVVKVPREGGECSHSRRNMSNRVVN